MTARGATLVIRVTPRAARPGIGPWRDGVLHVRVRQPAVDGGATAAALVAVADALDVTTAAVRLESGSRSRVKRLTVAGMDAAELARRLATVPD